MVFRFSRHESLQDAVAVVVGMLGEQLGIMLFPTEQDYWSYLEQAQSGMLQVEQLCCWCAHLDPVDELPESHVALGWEVGLVQEGLTLQLYAVRGGVMERLELAEESTLLSAVQGILGAWRTHRSSLVVGESTTSVRTHLGDLEVQTRVGHLAQELPDSPEPLILEADHQVILQDVLMDGEEVPGLILKMAKRDARRLARLIDEVHEVDAISIEELGDWVDIIAWEGGLEVGVLARVPPQDGLWDAWREVGHGGLVIAGGGAKRRTLREQDAVLAIHVDLYDPEGQDLPLFGDSLLEAASWDGPTEDWPTASTVLLDFAEPLGVAELPGHHAEQALTFAALVWSAVVMADFGGQPEVVKLARRNLPPGELQAVLERLVERKRSLYSRHNRIIQVESLTSSEGQMDLRVSWTAVD